MMFVKCAIAFAIAAAVMVFTITDCEGANPDYTHIQAFD
jgi:hypothetical protein